MNTAKLRPTALSLLAPLLLGACSAAPGADQSGAADQSTNPKSPAGYALAAAQLPDQATVASLAAQVAPAVVNITVRKAAPRMKSPFGGMPFGGLPFGPQPRGEGHPTPSREGAGSGFIIDPSGEVITNAHVVDGADEVTVRLKDDREFDARVVGKDEQLDLALLKIDDAGALPAVRLGDSEGLLVGEHVLAVGNPFGLGHTVTLGIVSAKARTIGAGPYDDFIQTDASINPGNSGGPLFNLRGEVVGINTAIRAGADGIGFAIPVDELKHVLKQLEEKGFVERGRLGVRFQPLDATMAKALGLDRPHGALVAEVEPNSPADAAGFEPGDVIMTVQGDRVKRAAQLPRLVARHGPGATIGVEVLRDGERVTLEPTLAELETDHRVPLRDRQTLEQPAEELLGLKLRNTPQGPAVIGMAEPHDQLRVGDVVLEVNGQPVRSVEALRAMLDAQKSDAVLLRVRRGDREIFLGLER